MTDKTIPALPAITSVADTTLFATDDTTQSYKTTALKVFNYIAAKLAWVTTDLIDDEAVTAAKLADDAVETDKILDGAVTAAKKAALNYNDSTSSGTFNSTSTSFVDVTNLSVTLTTNGRPVLITLGPDGSTDVGFFGRAGGGSGLPEAILLEDGVQQYIFGGQVASGQDIHPLSMVFLCAPAAGVHTYKIQARVTAGSTTVQMRYFQLIAIEL